MRRRLVPLPAWWLFVLVLLAAAPPSSRAQAPAAAGPAAVTAPAAPAPPASPVPGIRNKLAAADLLSAESILEVYIARNGEDGNALMGRSWLARGALLVGDATKAKRYAAEVRARCADSIAHGVDPAKDGDVEIALGAAIEVRAQLLARSRGAAAAAAYVRGELSHLSGPVALRSRLNKRINLLTLTGHAAPEIVAEDFVGAAPPALGSLKGSPVVIFVWAQFCSDCKSQASLLARARARYASRGVRLYGLTRYYEEPDSARIGEKARVDSVWKAVYADVGAIPLVISTASMERYGGSSTPTYVFVDRRGIVRRYTPTRLTEAEFDRAISTILR